MELWAALAAFLCVWLAVKNHILNWPISIISSLPYFFVFYEGKLYSDALLQVVFFIMQGYGWYSWYQKTGKNSDIRAVNATWFAAPFLITFALWALWYFFLIAWKPDASYPIWDAGTTVFSLLAIYMQAKRILENWWLWIGVDLFYIPLYWQKGMFLTALLYTIYLGLALWGWWQWKKIMQRQATPAT